MVSGHLLEIEEPAFRPLNGIKSYNFGKKSPEDFSIETPLSSASSVSTITTTTNDDDLDQQQHQDQENEDHRYEKQQRFSYLNGHHHLIAKTKDSRSRFSDNDDESRDYYDECVEKEEKSKLLQWRQEIDSNSRLRPNMECSYQNGGHQNGSSRDNRRFKWPKFPWLMWSFRKKRQCLLLTGICILCMLSFILYLPIVNDAQRRLVTIPGWNQNTSRDTASYIKPDKYTTLIEPNVISESPNKIFLLIVVCSAVDHFATRQTIRETWANVTEFKYTEYFDKFHGHLTGSYLPVNRTLLRDVHEELVGSRDSVDPLDDKAMINDLNVRVIFLMGRAESNESQQVLQDESDLHGDIIQEDFYDSYNNLTLKTVMLLKWVKRLTLNEENVVKFVMKCDDDTFLNVPNLVHVLLGGTVPLYKDTLEFYDIKTIKTRTRSIALKSMDNLLMGYLFCKAKPIADVFSKWYAPYYMFSGNVYPNYLSGTGYVMSMDTVRLLYEISLGTPIFHLEDVFVTGICARESKIIKPHHSPLFTYTFKTDKLCSMRGMITNHPLTMEDIRRVYSFVANTTVLCPAPSKVTSTRNAFALRTKGCV